MQEVQALGLHPYHVSRAVACLLDKYRLRQSIADMWRACTQQLLQLPDALTGDNR